MARDGFWPKALAVLVAALVILNLLFAFLAESITAAACGARPSATAPLSGTWLALSGDPSTYLPPAGCAMPVLPIRLADAAALVVLAVLAVWAGMVWARYQQSDAKFVADLRQRPGFATASEIRRHLSAKAVLRRAGILLTGRRNPAPGEVGWKVGRSRGLDVYVSIEDSVALEGAPRSGKGYRILISAILDWSGPLITTSTTNDNLTATLQMRRRRGEVFVFDPQQLSGIRDTLRINPIAGCEDPLVAVQRGTAIVTGTALGASATNQEWAAAAGTVLSRLLHAAAVGHRNAAELYQWGSTPALARTAVEILRSDGAPGWGDGLEAVLIGDEKLLSSTWFGVQAAVAPLAIPQIREVLQPTPGGPVFDAEAFLNGENTLYLLGSGSGAGAMGGFLSAILDDTVEVARRKALASPGARLEQPLGLILDEIANMMRWAALPKVMADGGGRGICTFVVLQALSQAETAWSRAEADTIWAAATAKVLLGGASQVAHLRDVEALLGFRERRRTQRSWHTQYAGVSTSEQQERLPLMTADEIRRLPQDVGLLTYRNRRGVLLDLKAWDERRDAATIQAAKRGTEAEQHEVFAQRYTRPTNTADAAGSAPAEEES
ncbi:type IV secretory system conjugative DNA transfer family protein [Leifsonia sp. TF02-11]|uniref:type IV secretory system conjugative DNA transfer family protein n=1 Tax=Leifsonia sp. TF02-11 TaxID=2815212 RepID=UPI001AA0C4FE|nr:TraM recognition domain-containing protein [Leifsonia sp. TF02-11]MBO1740747.1 type IV secretory system conjugative DNA transfer family protein [Leifsonia sp. TF02-11]